MQRGWALKAPASAQPSLAPHCTRIASQIQRKSDRGCATTGTPNIASLCPVLSCLLFGCTAGPASSASQMPGARAASPTKSAPRAIVLLRLAEASHCDAPGLGFFFDRKFCDRIALHCLPTASHVILSFMFVSARYFRDLPREAQH